MESIEGIVSRFIRYVNCASQSHNERPFCEYMERELTGLGIPFVRQKLGSHVVTDGWNILAKVPGQPNQTPFLFVFHMDTASPSNRVDACVENGRVHSRGNSVLGADGKLAIALVMEALSRLIPTGQIRRPLELLFTVGQELGLLGAKYADYSQVESEEALVIDHYVTGEVLLHTPARYYIHAEIIGRDAHVIRDDDPGINALTAAADLIHQIPTGRVGPDLSINIFDLVSLSNSNAVPRHARFDMEIRCFGRETWEDISRRIQAAGEDVARRTGCKCSLRQELDVPESDFSQNQDMLRRLETIFSHARIPMIPARSFGVLDASCTNQIGIRTVPIGLSIYHSHSVREYVNVDDMADMLRLVETIIQEF